ncbi:MAG TPA: GyrI-like domain-containing protein, partial [Longimicrobiales bacterium]
RWTALIRTPDFVTDEDLQSAVAELKRKGKGPAVERVRLQRLEEGECVQVLHVGPYSAEPPTIEALHAFAAQQGRTLSGRHHEIYLSDPRRVPPERLKTILRQPVT